MNRLKHGWDGAFSVPYQCGLFCPDMHPDMQTVLVKGCL